MAHAPAITIIMTASSTYPLTKRPIASTASASAVLFLSGFESPGMAFHRQNLPHILGKCYSAPVKHSKVEPFSSPTLFEMGKLDQAARTRMDSANENWAA